MYTTLPRRARVQLTGSVDLDPRRVTSGYDAGCERTAGHAQTFVSHVNLVWTYSTRTHTHTRYDTIRYEMLF